MSPRKTLSFLLAGAALSVVLTTSRADQITLNLTTPFGPNNAPPPTLTTAVATFTQTTATKVHVNLTTTGGLSTDYISAFAFNLDPNLVPPDLPPGNPTNFSSTGNAVNWTTFADTTPTQVDESGLYSIVMSFSGTTFKVGDTISFDLTDQYGLTAADFHYLAATNPANPGLYDADGLYYSAIDVHTSNNSAYSWVGAAPAPDAGETLALLSLGLAGLGCARRRFGKR